MRQTTTPAHREAHESTRKLTPPELAARWGVALRLVLSWIASGELKACNLACRAGGRPRWRISPEALREFEQKRAAVPVQTPARRPKATGVREYY